MDVEGGGHRRAWARRLEAYVKVVRELLFDGELVEETDEDLVEQGDEVVVQAAPRPGALKQYYLPGRRPASWTIWHSRLMLALIASMGLASSQLILRLE